MSEEALMEIIRGLRMDLEIERKNRPFNDEMNKNFEEALGPHPTIKNGCWIVRANELRQERDKLRAMCIVPYSSLQPFQ